MTQRCHVCAHPDVAAINEAMPSASIRQLAAQFGLTRDGLMRHRDRHTANSANATRERHARPPRESEPVRINFGHRAHAQHRNRNAREMFLEAYRSTGNLSQSAAAAHVARGTVYRWREDSDEFNAAFNQAEIEAVELLEAEARERATKGTKLTRRVIRGGRLIEEVEEWRPSDAMLIKLLQALRPEKYGDRLSVTQTTIVKTIDSEAWEAV